MATVNVLLSKMNPMLGTLLIFGGILFVFFIMPIISLIGFTIVLGEADLTPIPRITFPFPPLSLKKTYHKGKIIWVDA